VIRENVIRNARSLTRLSSHITFHASRFTRGTGLAQEAGLKAPCNRKCPRHHKRRSITGLLEGDLEQVLSAPSLQTAAALRARRSPA